MKTIHLPAPLTPTTRLLTPDAFPRLADVPPELEWLANKIDVSEFNSIFQLLFFSVYAWFGWIGHSHSVLVADGELMTKTTKPPMPISKPSANTQGILCVLISPVFPFMSLRFMFLLSFWPFISLVNSLFVFSRILGVGQRGGHSQTHDSDD